MVNRSRKRPSGKQSKTLRKARYNKSQSRSHNYVPTQVKSNGPVGAHPLAVPQNQLYPPVRQGPPLRHVAPIMPPPRPIYPPPPTRLTYPPIEFIPPPPIDLTPPTDSPVDPPTDPDPPRRSKKKQNHDEDEPDEDHETKHDENEQDENEQDEEEGQDIPAAFAIAANQFDDGLRTLQPSKVAQVVTPIISIFGGIALVAAAMFYVARKKKRNSIRQQEDYPYSLSDTLIDSVVESKKKRVSGRTSCSTVYTDAMPGFLVAERQQLQHEKPNLFDRPIETYQAQLTPPEEEEYFEIQLDEVVDIPDLFESALPFYSVHNLSPFVTPEINK